MLQAEYLDQIISITREDFTSGIDSSIVDCLIADDGELWVSDLWRLCRSAECAFHAGQLEVEVSEVLGNIVEAFRQHPDPVKIVAPSAADAWRNAISLAWRSPSPFPLKSPDKTRSQVVGEACKRLKAKGYTLPIRAFGADWNDRSLQNACRTVERHISRLGGEAVVNQLGGVISDTNGIYEGIWLFGDRGLGIGQPKEAAIPYGWLIGLAAKHMHRPNTCRNPSIAWRSMIELSRDIAASFDCQRYSQFEDIGGIAIGQIASKMSEAIGWRALFFTPQAPKLLLPRLQSAFREVLDDKVDWKVKPTVLGLIREAIELVELLRVDGCTSIHTAHAQRVFPRLLELSSTVSGKVNRGYHKPFGGASREDTKFIMFSGPKNTLVIWPVGMTVEALCETVFEFIWSNLPSKRAKEIVGKVIELAISQACEGKADRVWHDVSYGSKRKRLQIDVATRTDQDITLIEAKAKSLTQDGQFGVSGKFYKDYAQSFLPMVKQLSRHDQHLQQGATPLASKDDASSLSVERIAVSPVSFGPIGDGLTTTALMTALASAKLNSSNGDDTLGASLSEFNKAVSEAMTEIALVAPKDEEGRHDFFDYFLFTHWLDLGQLIFALDRSENVRDALRPVRHVTTGSRDFWTDYSHMASLRNE
ncbi:hypothetical protein [Phaeobacter sp. LSS9]|uniref:hypothetical protein n=1 Tax=unclassified Phaeobacter TaxID=2621772 RepID=UPI0013C2F1F9|nr:hypothetical protein [Phaeobacter sp. LSS9]